MGLFTNLAPRGALYKPADLGESLLVALLPLFEQFSQPHNPLPHSFQL